MPKVKSAFLRDIVSLPVKSLVPTRGFDARERNHQKYKQIAASIASVRVIEPLVVFPEGAGHYRVLGGRKSRCFDEGTPFWSVRRNPLAV